MLYTAEWSCCIHFRAIYARGSHDIFRDVLRLFMGHCVQLFKRHIKRKWE